MKRFEVLSAHLSNCIINKEDFVPYKVINIQARVNFEAQQDLLSTNGPSPEDFADEFAAQMREMFLNHFSILGPDENDAKKFSIETKELEDKNKFGWFELYNKDAQ